MEELSLNTVQRAQSCSPEGGATQLAGQDMAGETGNAADSCRNGAGPARQWYPPDLTVTSGNFMG